MDINAKLIYSAAAAAAVRLKRKTFKKDSSVKTILRTRTSLVCYVYEIMNNHGFSQNCHIFSLKSKLLPYHQFICWNCLYAFYSRASHKYLMD